MMKFLPDKVGTVELGLDDLKTRMVKNYVTSIQVEDTIRIHMGDIERRCKEENYKLIEEIKSDINKRMPSSDMISMLNRTSKSLELIDSLHHDIHRLREKHDNVSCETAKNTRVVTIHKNLLGNSTRDDFIELQSIIMEKPKEKKKVEEHDKKIMEVEKKVLKQEKILLDTTSDEHFINNKMMGIVCSCVGECTCKEKKLTTNHKLDELNKIT
jgi:ABC-type Fe3+-citrate transport system substrate-binding protein